MTKAQKTAYLARAQKELELASAAENESPTFENYGRVANAMACVKEAKELLGVK